MLSFSWPIYLTTLLSLAKHTAPRTRRLQDRLDTRYLPDRIVQRGISQTGTPLPVRISLSRDAIDMSIKCTRIQPYRPVHDVCVRFERLGGSVQSTRMLSRCIVKSAQTLRSVPAAARNEYESGSARKSGLLFVRVTVSGLRRWYTIGWNRKTYGM